jgi:two-component system, chemotaxis family, chemotaxis protein CheV
LSSVIGRYKPRFTGSFNIETREILIVDLEHIVAELDTAAGMSYTPNLDDAHVDAVAGMNLTERRTQKHLLIAEDSAIIRDSIVRLLEESGYTRVSAFVDGEECYRAILDLKGKRDASNSPSEPFFDLLISDIEMPKMDGLTLCRRLKEDAALRSIPVIMFSSLITEQMASHCDQVGADGYISKPQISELIDMIDGFLLK